MTADKLLTSFLGAAAALLLKYVYDAVVEHNRLEVIRKMIYIDLELHLSSLNSLLDDCAAILHSIEPTNDDEYIHLNEMNSLNLTVFKSHPAKDYFLAFSKDLYYEMMTIYEVIEMYKKIEINELYDKYLSELDVSEIRDDLLEDDFSDRIQHLYFVYTDIKADIENFLKAYDKEYQPLY